MNNQPIETKNYRKPKMTKKKKIAIISSVSGAALLCVCAVAFWFMHPHTCNNWKTVKAPTCTENGEEMGVCFCGTTVMREILAGHTAVIDKGYAATKTEDGLTDGIHCGVCNEIIKVPEKIYAIGSQGLAYTVIPSKKTCKITGVGTCTDTEIVIPRYIDGYEVVSIGYAAFNGCNSLTSITIPEGVISIGDDLFKYCSSLTSITVSKGNTSYKSIDGVLFTYDETTLICYPLGKKETQYAIPEGVTSIGDSAFEGCGSLTSVTIPEGVISIGDSAFKGCDSLTSVTIYEGVTSIGKYAFYKCSSLISVSIPKGVTSIGIYTFKGCSSLTSVTLPDGLMSIGDRAFEECSSLMSVTIPKGVTSIGKCAFYKCSSLTSVTLPDGITSIEDSAFYKCSSLTSVTIPQSVTSIERYAFYKCSSLTSVTIREGVTSIGWYAFSRCDSLTSITIPESVARIEGGAFLDSGKLMSIIYSGSVSKWNAIPKGDDWDRETDGYTVYCTDGRITKNGTVTYN